MGQNPSQRAKNTCLSIPSGLGTTLEKMIFFALGNLVDPPLAPTVRGQSCPPAPPSEHEYKCFKKRVMLFEISPQYMPNPKGQMFCHMASTSH